MQGNVNVLDTRIDGKKVSCSVRSSLNVHTRKINAIDFHTSQTHMFTTACTDGAVCIWDLRHMQPAKQGAKVSQYKALDTLRHGKACHGALHLAVLSAFLRPSTCTAAEAATACSVSRSVWMAQDADACRQPHVYANAMRLSFTSWLASASVLDHAHCTVMQARSSIHRARMHW